MRSPISGLSLLIHIAVILVAVIASFAFGERRVASSKRALSLYGNVRFQPQLLQAISIVMIFTLGFFMILATTLAIRTSMNEGTKEPHIVFLKSEYDIVHEASVHMFEHWSANVGPDSFQNLANDADGKGDEWQLVSF
jgi:hypothetical protein